MHIKYINICCALNVIFSHEEQKAALDKLVKLSQTECTRTISQQKSITFQSDLENINLSKFLLGFCSPKG